MLLLEHNLAAMACNATDVKSFQYVLIVKAGLAVAEEKEMSKSDIEEGPVDSRQISWYLTSLDSLRKFFEDIILNVGF